MEHAVPQPPAAGDAALLLPRLPLVLAHRYPDSAAISDWAREAVAMMTQYELMNGTSKGFEPKKEMTLEQCLVLLTRICEF